MTLQMPMNFKYTRQGPDGWKFYGTPGTPATTMDAIMQGLRTSTLRKGLSRGLEPGGNVLFTDSDGRRQPAIVTGKRMVDPSMAEELSRTERWTPEFLRWYMGQNGLENGRMEQLLYQLPNQGVIATPRQGWSNRAGSGYEVSSQGDKRFSALYARLPDGRTIEDAWGQAKGYADGRSAKGKPALAPGLDYWGTYKGLWEQWATANPGLIDELAEASQGQPLVDRFARTENNQARALAEILASRTPLATPRMAGDALISAAAAPTGPIWAFGGARATPPDVLELISLIGKKHAEGGGRIVHGGAPGADRAASRLVSDPQSIAVYLAGQGDLRGPDPVAAGGRAFDSTLYPTWQEAHAIARQYEDPHRPGGRNYNARNVMVLLGPKLDAPREKLVVWSPGAQAIGGTGHAIRTAEGRGIPVRNLADPIIRAAAERWLGG